MEETKSVKRGAKPAISTHPAFPAIVALWFAALLGLGSLVLPVALFETLVTVSGISALVPAAEPPLGFTARTVIALVGAIGGAVIGLLLARHVARLQAPANARSLADRRPISAHDELGQEGLGSFGLSPAGLKRRALALSEEPVESRYLDPAPAEPAPLAESPVEDEDERQDFAPTPQAEAYEPFELSGFAEHEPAGETTEEYEAPAFPHEQADDHAPMQDQTMTEDRSFASPAEAGTQDEQEGYRSFAAPARDTVEDAADLEEPRVAAPRLAAVSPQAESVPAFMANDRPLEELGLVQLAARLSTSIEKRRALKAAARTAPPIIAPAAAQEVSAPAPATDFEVAEADDAARAIASFFGSGEPASMPQPAVAAPFEAAPDPEFHPARESGPELPSALREWSIEDDYEDEEEDEAFAGSFSLPIAARVSGHGLSPVRAIDEEAGVEEDESADGGYSSLLAMKNPFSRHEEFVAMDDPELETDGFEPAQAFTDAPFHERFGERPEQAWEHDPADFSTPFAAGEKAENSGDRTATARIGRDPSETGRDLRAALATLQRMNGGA